MDNQNTESNANNFPEPKKSRVYFRWYVLVIAILVLLIGALVFLWKPWESQANARTVSVTGKATVTAEPDEYDFNPSYEFRNVDKNAALAAMTAKSNEVVAGLKKLGVADNKIKTNSNGYDTGTYYQATNEYIYTLQLTVKSNDKALTQKIQDYLVSTKPTGDISPTATFSDQKQNELESQARDKAEKDAHDKAAQSAKNLGFKVGKVKSIEDGSLSGGGCGPVFCRTLMNGANVQNSPQDNSLSVQPGQNDLDYSVTVVYYIR